MKQHAVIVGAGLSGSLLALMLARRGYTLDVYERRPDLRKDQTIGVGRSINLALSVRGLHALSQVGLREQVLTEAIAMPGRMLHARDGHLTFQRYGKDDSECIYSISRGFLNRVLMTEAEKWPGVKIHFETPLESADLNQGVLRFGVRVDVRAPLIFGTDGSASPLRDAMHGGSRGYETQDGDQARVSVDTLAHGYKELTLEPGPGDTFALEPHALHIWPRGKFMMIALPNRDRTFTCTLFLSAAANSDDPSEPHFGQLDTSAKVRAFFDAEFKDLSVKLPNLEAQFFANPTGQMVTVKAPRWVSDTPGCRAVLLGDAAHAIVPFFGQGMNCAFEDVAVLGELIEGAGEESPELQKFFTLRKPNADAIADMARENFVEMRDKTADPRFLLEKQVEQVLSQQFPGRYRSRYALVSFSRVPYALAYRCGEIHRRILDRILDHLAAQGVRGPVSESARLTEWLPRDTGAWIDADLEPLMRDARRYL